MNSPPIDFKLLCERGVVAPPLLVVMPILLSGHLPFVLLSITYEPFFGYLLVSPQKAFLSVLEAGEE